MSQGTKAVRATRRTVLTVLFAISLCKNALKFDHISNGTLGVLDFKLKTGREETPGGTDAPPRKSGGTDQNPIPKFCFLRLTSFFPSRALMSASEVEGVNATPKPPRVGSATTKAS